MIFLETERLRLRNVCEKDVDEIYDYRNSEVCSKFQRDQTKDHEGIFRLVEERRRDIWSEEASFMIAVALKETDGLIGEIVVMPCEGTFSFGYTFSYKVHRRGYAYEALSALMEELRRRYPKWDYVSFTEVDNTPSRALLEKLGFADLGYLPSKDSEVFGKWLSQATLEEVKQAVR